MDEESVTGAESTVAPDGKAEADRICDRWVKRDLPRERGQGLHRLFGGFHRQGLYSGSSEEL